MAGLYDLYENSFQIVFVLSRLTENSILKDVLKKFDSQVNEIELV